MSHKTPSLASQAAGTDQAIMIATVPEGIGGEDFAIGDSVFVRNAVSDQTSLSIRSVGGVWDIVHVDHKTGFANRVTISPDGTVTSPRRNTDPANEALPAEASRALERKAEGHDLTSEGTAASSPADLPVSRRFTTPKRRDGFPANFFRDSTQPGINGPGK